jgi:hypothetical protein
MGTTTADQGSAASVPLYFKIQVIYLNNIIIVSESLMCWLVATNIEELFH